MLHWLSRQLQIVLQSLQTDQIDCTPIWIWSILFQLTKYLNKGKNLERAASCETWLFLGMLHQRNRIQQNLIDRISCLRFVLNLAVTESWHRWLLKYPKSNQHAIFRSLMLVFNHTFLDPFLHLLYKLEKTLTVQRCLLLSNL